jgi:membrane protease subunit HflK
MIGASRDGATMGSIKAIGAVALSGLLVGSLRRTGLRPGLSELVGNARATIGWLGTLRVGPLLRSRLVRGALVLWLMVQWLTGFVAVPPGYVGLRQRFGRLVGEPLAPGLAFAWPLAESLSLVRVGEVRAVPVGYRMPPSGLVRTPVLEESIAVTGDENVIDLHTEVQYRVADAVRFRLGVENADALLARLVRARLIEAMAGRPIDRVYTDARREVEAALVESVGADASALGLGIEVLAVRLLDVHAPGPVHDAFRDVASASEDRITTQHRAREYAAGVVALARGEAARSIADADAQAATRVATASGAAFAFRALADEHHRAPAALEQRLQIESAERVLPGVRKIVRPTTGAATAFELWLREGGTPFPPAPASAAEAGGLPAPTRGSATAPRPAEPAPGRSGP